MTPKMRLHAGLIAFIATFSGLADAFWRMPCRGQSGVARMDPMVDPGSPSYHVHSIHGSGGFSMSADMASLREGSCTSCGVLQDKSAYWAPALYFMHANGDAELVEEVGGMLAYYLLYGENVTAFPDNFRMIAGDTFQRNFTWPVPDPPKSDWSGDQLSQAALRQKALGFNCLNYNIAPEPSLGRHFLPNKTYLDENCVDGVRFELMFPSCWNGKDVDSENHKSHMAYPTLVMDGTCPEGFETRLVSLFYETIWNTYAFKGVDGYFVLANGDPTGFGYHGDFMFGWEEGVLEQAVEVCTNMSGEISDCPIFDLQSQDDQQQCTFDLPAVLQNENVTETSGGLPNNLVIEWGPAYAFPIAYTTPTTTAAAPSETNGSSASDPIDSSVQVVDQAISNAVSYIEDTITEEIVYLQRQIIVLIDEQGNVVETETGSLQTISSTTLTTTTTVPTTAPGKRDDPAQPAHKRHHHGRRHYRG